MTVEKKDLKSSKSFVWVNAYFNCRTAGVSLSRFLGSAECLRINCEIDVNCHIKLYTTFLA